MKQLRYSRRAESDLEEVGDYTFEKWGRDQAIVYIGQLGACAQLVFENPMIARTCDDLRSGYRRLEEGSHVLFFKPDDRGLLVVRVLHERMVPGLHLDEEDEDE
ncbi:MAG: hypothetical protein RL701_941 [Pseudomonadota bacterium]